MGNQAPARVEVREPIPLLRRSICAALAAHGLDVVDDDPEVVVWAVADEQAVRGSAAPVLALVERTSEPAVRRLYAAGVRGVLQRDTDPTSIALAAAAVGAGLVVSQPELCPSAPADAEEVLVVLGRAAGPFA